MILAAAATANNSWELLFALTILGVIFFVTAMTRLFGIGGFLIAMMISIIACVIISAHYAATS